MISWFQRMFCRLREMVSRPVRIIQVVRRDHEEQVVSCSGSVLKGNPQHGHEIPETPQDSRSRPVPGKPLNKNRTKQKIRVG